MITYKQIFEEFKEWSPQHAIMVVDYRPWGTYSIVVWLKCGMICKVKRVAPNNFVMQKIFEEDVRRKLNL